MLRQKLQYFGHLMWRTDLLEKTLMLEKIEGGWEGDNRGWDGWMTSLTQWRWVWVNSRSWWWTGKPGMLQSMGSQRVRHDWATELNWIFHCLHESSCFIHSPAEGHLYCFQVVAIMNEAAISIHVQGFVWHKFSTHLSKYQGVWLLDHMVRVCLVLLAAPQVAVLLGVPASNEWGCLLLCILVNIWCCQWPVFWPR